MSRANFEGVSVDIDDGAEVDRRTGSLFDAGNDNTDIKTAEDVVAAIAQAKKDVLAAVQATLAERQQVTAQSVPAGTCAETGCYQVNIVIGNQCNNDITGWKLGAHYHKKKDKWSVRSQSVDKIKVIGARAMVHKSSTNCVSWNIIPVNDGTGEVELEVSPINCEGFEKTRWIAGAKLGVWDQNKQRDGSSSFVFVCDDGKCGNDGGSDQQCTKWKMEALPDDPRSFTFTVANSCDDKDNANVLGRRYAGRTLAAHSTSWDKRDSDSWYVNVHKSSTNCRTWKLEF